jgi:phosphomannomutase
MPSASRARASFFNVICSWTVREVIRENGGVPVRTRVGHSFIKQVMAETGAIFGGEHSGHYYFRENYRADSGLIAAVIVLAQLSEANVPLSELLAPFRRYAASGEINTEVKDPLATIELVAEALKDGEQDRLDGLTVEFEDWVQRAAVQHGAAPAPERRGPDRRAPAEKTAIVLETIRGRREAS